MYIEKILIKNFRSIIEETLLPSELTVLVGKNDVGKSNFLKALNLFFNDETDFGQKFDFETDYSRFTAPKKKKAKEVSIQIIFSPPDTFRDHSKKIVWTKFWREEGFYKEVKCFGDKSMITSRSRLLVWLKRLRYRYVPAVKSNDYFSFLLKELYEILYFTIKSDLQTAGRDFVDKIRQHTDSLSKGLEDQLGFSSKIQLPEDLADLFSTLDFETDSKGHIVSLKHRGDGIKARHISVILQFLAEKERLHHSKGAVRSDTIWGYEEPENNLELVKAFELANEFISYIPETQIFLTTHSPAFYTIGKDWPSNVEVFNVYLESNLQSSKLKEIVSIDGRDLDANMGLLPIVAPYVLEKQNEIEELDQIIFHLKDETKPIVFVEGVCDKEILTNAWQKLNKNKRVPFKIQESFDRHFIGNTFSREDVFRNAENRIYIGILDFDEAFENWERIKLSLSNDKSEKWRFAETNIQKGLRLQHKKYLAHILLLPVPGHRKEYASLEFGKHSKLSIELLFLNDKLQGYAQEESLPGGGKILKMQEDKKTQFAKSTNDFEEKDFNNFIPIFETIEQIILSS